MSSPDDNNHIDALKDSLYSRSSPDVRTRRKLRFTEEGTDVKTDWATPEKTEVEPVVLNTKYKNSKMSFFTKFFLVSAVFCILAVSIGAYIFFNGVNLISADNIDIKISGPVSIPGGEPVSFDVIAFNKNNVDLQLVDMKVDFPDGSVDPNNPSNSLQTYSKIIGNIKAGGNARESIKAVIFGEENSQKQITVSLTYGVKGSSSVFTKVQSYNIILNSSPINVTVSSFTELTSGQEFDMVVSLKSNSEETLKKVLLKATYPFGYEFISSSLTTLSDKATWKIGDILPGQERKVTIHGKLTGEDNDLRVFRFMAGAGNSSEQSVIGTQYMTLEHDITIEKPFITLKLNIGNDQSSEDYVSQYNNREDINLTWFNNLSTSISNVEIKVKLAGTAYDNKSVNPYNGYFDSATDVISWNQRTNPELANIGANESGKISFSIKSVDRSTNNNNIVNPEIIIFAKVSGRRSQEANVPQTIDLALTRKIAIASKATLSGRIVRSGDTFTNIGPIPPRVNIPTTYTVIWDVDNTSSTLGDASVKATLPPYVKWLGNVSPISEDVKFNRDTGLVTWNVGSVDTFTLNSSTRKEVAFQVEFTPNINQVGSLPELTGPGLLVATDNFTGKRLSSEQDALTTRFSTDPTFKFGDERVAE